MDKYFNISYNNKFIKCKMFYNDLDNIKKVILSCHGFTSSKDNRTVSLLSSKVLDKYDDVLIISFDLPGHGSDKSIIDLDECNNYLDTIIKYIKNNYNGDIYAQGSSFGGYLFLKYIYENGNPFKKIALRCPAVNMYDALVNNILSREKVDLLKHEDNIKCFDDSDVVISKKFLSELKKNNILKYDFSSFSNDILTIHGTCDNLINHDISKSFCLKNNISFKSIIDCDHRFSNYNDLSSCIDFIISFYNL